MNAKAQRRDRPQPNRRKSIRTQRREGRKETQRGRFRQKSLSAIIASQNSLESCFFGSVRRTLASSATTLVGNINERKRLRSCGRLRRRLPVSLTSFPLRSKRWNSFRRERICGVDASKWPSCSARRKPCAQRTSPVHSASLAPSAFLSRNDRATLVAAMPMLGRSDPSHSECVFGGDAL